MAIFEKAVLFEPLKNAQRVIDRFDILPTSLLDLKMIALTDMGFQAIFQNDGVFPSCR